MHVIDVQKKKYWAQHLALRNTHVMFDTEELEFVSYYTNKTYKTKLTICSIVLPIVNGGDTGCIVRDLETIIVLLLLAFNFILQRSHNSLTLSRSRIGDSATVTLTPGDSTTAIKVEP